MQGHHLRREAEAHLGGRSPPHIQRKEANTTLKLQLRSIYSLRTCWNFFRILRKNLKFLIKNQNKTKPSAVVLSHIVLAPPYQQCVTYITRLAFICTMHSDSKGYVHHVNKKRGIKCTLKNRAAQTQENLKS